MHSPHRWNSPSRKISNDTAAKDSVDNIAALDLRDKITTLVSADRDSNQNTPATDSDQPLSLKTKLLNLFYNGSIGGLTFAISVGFLFIQLLFMGHIPNSKLYLSATISAILWAFMGSSVICGFNSGLSICVGRCIGAKDWQGIERFFKMSINCNLVLNIFFYVYGQIIYICIPYLYDQESKAELIYWTRQAIPVVFVAYSILNISDVYRNLFVGCGCLGTAILVEFLGVILSASTGWFLGLFMGYGFYGISVAMNITMFAVLGMYHWFFCYGKDFKEYWQEIKNDSHDDTGLEQKVLLLNKEKDPLNSSPKDSNKHKQATNSAKHEELQNPEKCEGDNLKIYKNFICWGMTFALSNQVETASANIGRLLVSTTFSLDKISALSASDNFAEMVWAFGIGFAVSLSAELSAMMMRKEVKSAKIYAVISIQMMLTLDLIMVVILLVFSDSFARMLSNDPNTCQIVVDTMIPYILYMTFENQLQLIFGITKAIGKEKQFFLGGCFSHSVVFFGAYYTFISLGFDYSSQWYGRVAQLISANVIGIFILLKTDWNVMADEIAKSISQFSVK